MDFVEWFFSVNFPCFSLLLLFFFLPVIISFYKLLKAKRPGTEVRHGIFDEGQCSAFPLKLSPYLIPNANIDTKLVSVGQCVS